VAPNACRADRAGRGCGTSGAAQWHETVVPAWDRRFMLGCTGVPIREREMQTILETARAEALFASSLQVSDRASADGVRSAVAATLRRLRVGGCVAHVAAEFGDHPDTAVRRMAWALATVRTVYSVRGPTGTRASPPSGRWRWPVDSSSVVPGPHSSAGLTTA
jgi:hypothetical protein